MSVAGPVQPPHPAAPTPPSRPQAAKVPLNEYEFPINKLANVQSQLENLVSKNYFLHQAAKDAFRCADSRNLKHTAQLNEQCGRSGVSQSNCHPRDIHSPPPRSYILAYHSHQLKEVFNVHTLDLKAVARSFGFETPPKVRLVL